jgi:regulator of CtrA degradation
MTMATGITDFGATYDEAMGLLVETRDYLAASPGGRGTPRARLALCHETTRITARLTRIMAWLLAQRAWLAGEIDRSTALGEALDGFAVCMEDDEGDQDKLPDRLADLLRRSRQLCRRVARLDALARRLTALGRSPGSAC